MAECLGSRLQNHSMACTQCGAVVESDIYALFECPVASMIWENNPFGHVLEKCNMASVWDVLWYARSLLNDDIWGEFVGIAWEV